MSKTIYFVILFSLDPWCLRNNYPVALYVIVRNINNFLRICYVFFVATPDLCNAGGGLSAPWLLCFISGQVMRSVFADKWFDTSIFLDYTNLGWGQTQGSRNKCAGFIQTWRWKCSRMYPCHLFVWYIYLLALILFYLYLIIYLISHFTYSNDTI